jgi:hypothetical protein
MFKPQVLWGFQLMTEPPCMQIPMHQMTVAGITSFKTVGLARLAGEEVLRVINCIVLVTVSCVGKKESRCE